MSNIDKHAVQAVADLKAGYTLGHADVAILNELARIALASLEVEPVGEVVLGEFDDAGCHPDARVACIAADGQANWENFKDGTRLYTAPPAQVSVPDGYRLQPISEYDAMCAAILQGAERVTTAYKLPECWVACSERMPDDEEDVLCFGQYGDNDIDEERYQFMGWLSSKGIKRVWRVSDGDSQNRRARVTHWMPLPAAPQREGENV
ncbi:TPA: DUF551 domain-containing protein [Enterobacter hormaechei subsp. xiangfangensis]